MLKNYNEILQTCCFRRKWDLSPQCLLCNQTDAKLIGFCPAIWFSVSWKETQTQKPKYSNLQSKESKEKNKVLIILQTRKKCKNEVIIQTLPKIIRVTLIKYQQHEPVMTVKARQWSNSVQIEPYQKTKSLTQRHMHKPQNANYGIRGNWIKMYSPPIKVFSTD